MISEGVIIRGIFFFYILKFVLMNLVKWFGLYFKKGSILLGFDVDLVIVDLD